MTRLAYRSWVAAPLLMLAACGGGADQPTAKLDTSREGRLARQAERATPGVGVATPEAAANAPPAQATAAPAGGTGGLTAGEYACYGSGGTILAGLGFKLDASGAYTDLDGKERGIARVGGGTIKFSGGHMDGMEGRDIKGGRHFTIGTMASCDLWG